jgi:hypothetical protein
MGKRYKNKSRERFKGRAAVPIGVLVDLIEHAEFAMAGFPTEQIL